MMIHCLYFVRLIIPSILWELRTFQFSRFLIIEESDMTSEVMVARSWLSSCIPAKCSTNNNNLYSNGVWRFSVWNNYEKRTCSVQLTCYVQLQQTCSDDMQPSEGTSVAAAATAAAAGPKRLHFSNLPFRLREADLRALLTVIVMRSCAVNFKYRFFALINVNIYRIHIQLIICFSSILIIACFHFSFLSLTWCLTMPYYRNSFITSPGRLYLMS